MMSSRREAAVEKAFADLDQHGLGYVPQRHLVAWYAARNHPSVRAGEMLESEAHQDFISTFAQFKAHHAMTSPEISTPDKGDGRGIVTFPEFKDYYTKVNIALGVDTTDDFFEAMIFGVWAVGEFEHADGASGGGGSGGGGRGGPAITLRRATMQGPVAVIEKELGQLRSKVGALEAREAERREALHGTSTTKAELELMQLHHQVSDARTALSAKERDLLEARARADKALGGMQTSRVEREKGRASGLRSRPESAIPEHESQIQSGCVPVAEHHSVKVVSREATGWDGASRFGRTSIFAATTFPTPPSPLFGSPRWVVCVVHTADPKVRKSCQPKVTNGKQI